ncbi:MAG: metalloenzyme [Chloroflexi bacterium]|nr:metalloenzyme [Chloroflexota bacterium]
MGVLFVFLDGVGLGPAHEANPFWRCPAPRLSRLLGGPLIDRSAHAGHRLLLAPLDATLDVPGLPQSATGQTSLFTGVNAAALLGGHLSAYPSERLRRVIAAHSVLRRATEAGWRATFANGYSAEYWARAQDGSQRHSASTLTNLAAGLPFRDLADVRQGRALFWDLTHQFVAQWVPEAPQWSAGQAAEVLLGLAADYDLVMYESFLTDLVGHRRLPLSDADTVALLDEFLGCLAQGLGPSDTLVVTSDHGNFEDDRRKTHTLQPVPLLAVGAATDPFVGCASILDVSGTLLRAVALTRGQTEPCPCGEVASE